MTSQKIIERLENGNWFIEVNNDHELALVFNACIDANITWMSGDKIKDFDLLNEEKKYKESVKVIYSVYEHKGITWDSSITQMDEENITNWFFKEIKK